MGRKGYEHCVLSDKRIDFMHGNGLVAARVEISETVPPPTSKSKRKREVAEHRREAEAFKREARKLQRVAKKESDPKKKLALLGEAKECWSYFRHHTRHAGIYESGGEVSKAWRSAVLELTVDHFGNKAVVKVGLESKVLSMLIELLRDAKRSIGNHESQFHSPEMLNMALPGKPQIDHKLAPLKRRVEMAQGDRIFLMNYLTEKQIVRMKKKGWVEKAQPKKNKKK